MQTFLGQNAVYISKYDNSLIRPISRNLGRNNLALEFQQFYGFDIWNCYEISWLSRKNKPEVRVMELIFDANSDNIIESKSLKLYLNSFNNSNFNGDEEVQHLIHRDLSLAVNSHVFVNIRKLESYTNDFLTNFSGINLDLLDVTMSKFEIQDNLPHLSSDDYIEESLYSNLLKSNCLVTHQPDWGSVQIAYKGSKINHESLLKYIISFRNHNEFHEQCIEHMWNDINKNCAPKELTIYGRYTRRGGIDINPIRSSKLLNMDDILNARHIRQ